MKFDSPIFDRIRVKPGEDQQPKPTGPVCGWAGCTAPATHRAPKGRDREGEYWRFCVDHVRQYNASYNYFAGMTDDDVTKYQKDALTGHRPTWRMGLNGDNRSGHGPDMDGAVDPIGIFREFGGARPRRAPDPEKPEREGRMIRNAERKALDTLGVELSATREEIKARFKLLVKRHHPDANGGDRSSEDRLREVIQAYNYLKTAGFA